MTVGWNRKVAIAASRSGSPVRLVWPSQLPHACGAPGSSARDQHRDDDPHRITVELEGAPPHLRASLVIAEPEHLAAIDQPDHQSGQEHEALRILDERQLVVVDVLHPIPAREDEMVDEHEDEEETAEPVDQSVTWQAAGSMAVSDNGRARPRCSAA